MKTITQTWIQTKITLTQAPSLAVPNQHGLTNISPATIKWMTYATTRLTRHIGNLEINTITPNHIADWQQHEMSRPITPNTANSYLRAIKVMFTRLQRNSTIGTNPAQPIDYWPEPTPTPKSISPAHYHTILATTTNPRNRAILAALWSTGCRLGGLISMRIDKIQTTHTDTGQPHHALYITEKGKNGKQKPRWVYSKGTEAIIIQTWLNTRPASRTPALFTIGSKKPRPLTKTAVSHLFHTIRQNNPNLIHANPHAFRHAFAIRNLDTGRDIALVSQWLGHHSPEYTAKIYAIRSEEELRRAYFSQL